MKVFHLLKLAAAAKNVQLPGSYHISGSIHIEPDPCPPVSLHQAMKGSTHGKHFLISLPDFRPRERVQRRLSISRASRADNRGDLRLFLDSASVFQWEKYAETEIFYGKQSTSCRHLRKMRSSKLDYSASVTGLLRIHMHDCSMLMAAMMLTISRRNAT